MSNKSVIYGVFGAKRRAAEFIQYLFPVGTVQSSTHGKGGFR